MHNSPYYSNPYQGDYKKVLCVCSMGLLRSPTAALVLSGKPFNFNTRSGGTDPSALVLAKDLLGWADEIVCMEARHLKYLKELTNKPIICLEIPDRFAYRDKALMKLIKQKYLLKSKL